MERADASAAMLSGYRAPRYDTVQRRVTTQMITLDGQGMHRRLVAIRGGWLAELDLMTSRPACG